MEPVFNRAVKKPRLPDDKARDSQGGKTGSSGAGVEASLALNLENVKAEKTLKSMSSRRTQKRAAQGPREEGTGSVRG
jgi:hypothetical protein